MSEEEDSEFEESDFEEVEEKEQPKKKQKKKTIELDSDIDDILGADLIDFWTH